MRPFCLRNARIRCEVRVPLHTRRSELMPCSLFVVAALLIATLTIAPSSFACVVGTGTSASCTEAALNACLPGGGSFDGTVTFNCGGAATITVTSAKTISADTIIDGGAVITVTGGGMVSVFSVNSGLRFTVENMTIANGINGLNSSAGAIVNDGTLTVTNSTFSDNTGGAILNEGN